MISTTVRISRKHWFTVGKAYTFVYHLGAVLPVKGQFRVKNGDFNPNIWLNWSVEGCHKAQRHMLHTNN